MFKIICFHRITIKFIWCEYEMFYFESNFVLQLKDESSSIKTFLFKS